MRPPSAVRRGLETLLDDAFDLLTAAQLPEAGPRTLLALSSREGLAAALARPQAHADLLSPAALDWLRSGAARRQAEQHAERARAQGLRLLGWHDPPYPVYLRHIYDPPPVLFVRGRLNPGEGERCVAIVGSRAASPQGGALARALAAELAAAGVTIVSGLAHGIDTAAHRGALDAKGRTVAVLGSSHDRLYPRENARLAEAIGASGAVVSELPPGSSAHPGTFPRRNRIIAALSSAVIVVEAGERSGALITANHALELGRGVAAVPGSIDAPQCAGSNALLRDGATIITSPEDALVLAGLSPRAPRLPLGARTRRSASRPAAAIPSPSASSTLTAASLRDPHQSRVLQAVSAGASDLASLVHETRLAPRDATVALASLELSGILWTDHAGGIRLAR